ncbi:5-methylcytosine-specific restriction enzyme B [Haloechinothrix alba]|uniref:5-methylcytosine-specific restriction enzyme B n=2 Tax=Haloechinothrix alba TaxID=664784 RepID=A0A238WKF2_9PSEU|nr:5-methylcytosine-specific restriction enzyme B [Haloechinothrix alba]
MRRPLLLRTMFDVLRRADGPCAAGDVLAAVAERVDLTPDETHRYAHSGGYRYRTYLHRASSWAHRVGWMVKHDGRWELTAAGKTAVDNIQDDGELARVLHRLYRQARHVSGVLEAVEYGSWVALSDVAAVTNVPTEQLVDLFGAGGVTNSHRVLADDGSLRSDAAGGDAQREQLADEGIVFDAVEQADPTARVTIEELRQALADTAVDAESTGTRAWLVRGSSVDGHNLVPTWLTQGWVSLAATNLRALDLPVSRAQLGEFVATDYQHKAYAVRQNKVAEFDAFLNQMKPDDLVLTTSGGKIYGATITGPASYTVSEDGHSNLRRPVSWLNREAPIAFGDLPEPLPAKLGSQADVVDLTDALPAIERMLLPEGEAVPPRELALPNASEDLARSLHLDQPWLQEIIELLRDRRQLIFYGPPGTGKTYVAQQLAAHLTEAHAYKLVQFHPSYSYEDFFEGYRPVKTEDGTLSFELHPGPLRRIVEVARDDPSTPYILIIDEINRANLAKVFGELYFLLEYRDRSIDLLYSTEETDFTLPPNVFFIGTMNTADRSIALVDAAMRRRFAFIHLHPAEPPVRGVLGRWLDVHELPDETARLLDELNRRIDDPDFAIGPSFFMRSDVHREGGLARTWRTDILPLLEEYHYGDQVDVPDRYDLELLRRAIAPARDVAGEQALGEDVVAGETSGDQGAP